MEENQQVETSPITEVEQNTEEGQEETSTPGTEGEQVEDPSTETGPLMVEIQRPHSNVITAITPEGEVEQEFNIIHEVTLGDLLISTLLLAILLFNLISRVVRR